MYVRAENRFDAYDLMNAGMLHVYRETIDTSLRMGVDVLKNLGHRAYTAERSARIFFKKDEANLKKLAAIKDEEEYINTAREYIEELEKMISVEISDPAFRTGTGWDDDSLIAEVNKLATEKEK
jgi:hypothetical protein